MIFTKQFFSLQAVLKVGIALAIALVLVSALLAHLTLAAPNFARTTLTRTDLSPNGTTLSLAATNGDGHSFANTGKEFLAITNGYTATITATIVTGGMYFGFSVEDVDIAIGAGVTTLVGPFNPGVFNQGDNTVYLNWNAAVTGTVVNSVTIAAYRMD